MLSYLAFFIIVSTVLGLAAWWLYREFRVSPAMTMSLILLYSLVSKQVSLLYIELVPSFLPEQAVFSSYSGASIRIAVMHITFLVGVVATCRFLNHYFPLKRLAERHILENPPDCLWLDLSAVAAIVLLLVQFVNIYLSQGVAILGGEYSRYDFWLDAARFPVLATIFGKTMAFLPPLIAVQFWSYGQRQKSYRQMCALCLLVPYWFFLYATGHRFTMTALNFGLFFSTYVLLRVYQSKPPVSFRFAVATLSVVFVAVLIGAFDLVNRHFARNSRGALDAFLERAFVIQGATMWTVDDAVMNDKLTGNAAQLVDGMNIIREVTLDPVNAEAYAEKGVNLSAGLPAICQIAFGNLKGAVVIVAFGIFFGIIFHLTSASVARGNLFGLCCAAMVLSWSNSVYGAASLRLILDWKYAFCLLVTFITIAMPQFEFFKSRRLRHLY